MFNQGYGNRGAPSSGHPEHHAIHNKISGIPTRPSAYGPGPGSFPFSAHNQAENPFVTSTATTGTDADGAMQDMRNFLGGADRSIGTSEGPAETLTVANQIGQRGQQVLIKSLVIQSAFDADQVPHFRILPLRKMSHAELAGVSMEVITFGTHLPQEAAEFVTPHFVQFRSSRIEARPLRFNHGCRIGMDMMATPDGQMYFSRQLAQIASDLTVLAATMVTSALMSADDLYRDQRQLIGTGHESVADFSRTLAFRGQTNGGSILAHPGTFGIFNRKNGFEWVLNWVDRVTGANGIKTDAVLVASGVADTIAYSPERTEYLSRGSEGPAHIHAGERMVASSFTSHGHEIIVEPTYDFDNAAIDSACLLVTPAQVGRWYLLDNQPYMELQSLRSSGRVSSKHGSGCAFTDAASAPLVNDLYYLDLSGRVTWRRQSYADIMKHAMCWDSAGNLDDFAYDQLFGKGDYKLTAELLGITIDDESTFLPDPWVVYDSGRYSVVQLVGNQDLRHTDMEMTKSIIDMTCQSIGDIVGDDAYTAIDDMLSIMHRNYEIKPDQSGDVEGFISAVAWSNISNERMTISQYAGGSASNILPSTDGSVNIPSVVPLTISGAGGQLTPTHVGFKRGMDDGNSGVLMKVQMVSTQSGPFPWNPVYGAKNAGIDQPLDYSFGSNIQIREDIFLGAIAFLNGEDFRTAVNLLNRPDFSSPTIPYAVVGVIAGLADIDGLADAQTRYANAMADILFPADHLPRLSEASRELTDLFRENPDAKQLADASPSYIWLDSELAESGVFVGPNRDLLDPAVTFLPQDGGVGRDDWRSFPSHLLWGARMLRAGLIKTAMHFITPGDFAKARFVAATVNPPNGLTMPGFSTVSSMRKIANLTTSSSDMLGWSAIKGSGEYFKTISRGISALDKYSDVVRSIFSSQENDGTAPNVFFRENMLAHFQRADGNSEMNQRTAFQQSVVDSIKAPLGIVHPFLHGNLSLGSGARVEATRATLRYGHNVVIRGEGDDSVSAKWLVHPVDDAVADIVIPDLTLGRADTLSYPSRIPTWIPESDTAVNPGRPSNPLSITPRHLLSVLSVAGATGVIAGDNDGVRSAQYAVDLSIALSRILTNAAISDQLQLVANTLLWGHFLSNVEDGTPLQEMFSLEPGSGIPPRYERGPDDVVYIGDTGYDVGDPGFSQQPSLFGGWTREGGLWARKYASSLKTSLQTLTEIFREKLEKNDWAPVKSAFARTPEQITATSADYQVLIRTLRRFQFAVVILTNLIQEEEVEEEDVPLLGIRLGREDTQATVTEYLRNIAVMADENYESVEEVEEASRRASSSMEFPRAAESELESGSRIWEVLQDIGRTLPVVNTRLSFSPTYWLEFERMVRAFSTNARPGTSVALSILRPHSSTSPGLFVGAPSNPTLVQTGENDERIRDQQSAGLAAAFDDIRMHGEAHHRADKDPHHWHSGASATLAHDPNDYRHERASYGSDSFSSSSREHVPATLLYGSADLHRHRDPAHAHAHAHPEELHAYAHPGFTLEELPNSHFLRRIKAAGPSVPSRWRLRAALFAYMGAKPTAQLMIALHNRGIPQPMTLICMDPFINFRMNSAIFVEKGRQTGWIGHDLTAQTQGMNSDVRELTVHTSTWLMAFVGDPRRVVVLPHASFSAYLRGGSGRIADLTVEVDRTNRRNYQEGQWDPSDPKNRTADRFIAYGGGSVTSETLGENICLLGPATLPQTKVHAGAVIPDALVPQFSNCNMSYPSAIVANFQAGFANLNNAATPARAFTPRNIYDIRETGIDERSSVWNVWMGRGNQKGLNPVSGRPDICRQVGCGALGELREGIGHIFAGAPGVLSNAFGDTAPRVRIET
jgi:hypothetical protein